ncbi:MmcQ/YjbR family DNA-binding protein [soil metagenome]
MATWDEVRQIAMSLPAVAEKTDRNGRSQWRVKDKPMVWERPLRRSDVEALGEAYPNGPGARVPDVGVKEALLSDGDVYFTTPHFDGYPAILVQLDNVSIEELEELVTEAWLTQAPKRFSREWLASNE